MFAVHKLLYIWFETGCRNPDDILQVTVFQSRSSLRSVVVHLTEGLFKNVCAPKKRNMYVARHGGGGRGSYCGRMTCRSQAWNHSRCLVVRMELFRRVINSSLSLSGAAATSTENGSVNNWKSASEKSKSVNLSLEFGRSSSRSRLN